jgi:hypothetical protein
MRDMPHTTLYQCVGCSTSIAGDERAVEYVERRQADTVNATVIEPLPQYAHEDHEELGTARGKARGYAPTGRRGVLDELRDSWRGSALQA